MTEVPKIVCDRLQAAAQSAQGPVHPDADLLAAFAEQALSATEREGVLGHLALCLDCREVVALALPIQIDVRDAQVRDGQVIDAQIKDESHEVHTTASRPAAPAPHWFHFARPNLRWAALAAAVAVLASVLLVYPGKLNVALLPPATRQIPPSSSSTQVASSSTSMDRAPLAKTETPQPTRTELQPSRSSGARGAFTASPQPALGMQLATNQKQSMPADTPKLPVTGGAMATFDSASGSRAANETVEVSAAASEPSPAPSPEGNLMARNEAPAIEKAKPAPQGIEAESSEPQQTPGVGAAGSARLQARNMMKAARASELSATPAPSAVWMIAAGVLQRSLDGGATWQNALQAAQPFLCYANHDKDVWAGGRAGTLFHSADGGVTWVQVEATINSQRLTSDVRHIDVPSAAEIVLFTTNNEVWSTVDSGKSWVRK